MATTAPHLEQPSKPEYSGPIVVFDNVSIAFEDKQVLQDISFTVEPGETRIILGPAGCGKSVLIKLVDGLICPDSGSIRIFGEEITTMREVDLFKLRARVGMVFQESALFDSMSVEDNVAYRMQQDLVPAAEMKERVLESLRFVELEDAVSKFPSELSGGMRRRVAIARAIVTKPELILYDSPTGGLDPITSTTIIELLIKQRDAWHNTSLVVTHRLQDAFMMATNEYDTTTRQMRRIPNKGIDAKTRFLVLNEGRIIFDGTTQQLVASDDPWIREYLT
jgi:phospholipid/cholesterol/gamma-HCH transport system ATP-binding protein